MKKAAMNSTIIKSKKVSRKKDHSDENVKFVEADIIIEISMSEAYHRMYRWVF